MANVTESIEDYRDNVESGELEDTLPWHLVTPYICGMDQDCRINYESSDRVDTIKIKRVELIDY